MDSTFFSPRFLAVGGFRSVSKMKTFANLLHLTDKFFHVAPYTMYAEAASTEERKEE
jgi:hypothetical protein